MLSTSTYYGRNLSEAWEISCAWHVSQDVCSHQTWWRLDLWQFSHGANGEWHGWSMSVVGFRICFWGKQWNLCRIWDFNLDSVTPHSGCWYNVQIHTVHQSRKNLEILGFLLFLGGQCGLREGTPTTISTQSGGAEGCGGSCWTGWDDVVSTIVLEGFFEGCTTTIW